MYFSLKKGKYKCLSTELEYCWLHNSYFYLFDATFTHHQFHLMCCSRFHNWHVCIRSEKTIVCTDDHLCSYYCVSCLLLARGEHFSNHIVAFINDLTKAHFSYRDNILYLCPTIIFITHSLDSSNGSHCRQSSCLSVNWESYSLSFFESNALQPYIRRVSKQRFAI